MTSSKHQQRAVRVGAAAQRARGTPAPAGPAPCSPGTARRAWPRARAPAHAASSAAASFHGTTIVAAACAGGDAGGGGDSLRREARAGLGEQAVDVPVVGAGELDHLLAARRRARQPQRASSRPRCPRRSGAPSRRPACARHLRRQLDLRRGRRAVARAPRRGRASTASTHRRVRVAEDQRAPGAHVVDVAVAVDVEELGALAARR